MIRDRLLLLASVALLVLLQARSALAGPPTDQLRAKIDQVVRTLGDPALKTKEKLEDRRRAIRNVTNDVFDWTEMAKQSLGRHWENASEADRQEFVTLFRDLLEHSYISQIESYSGEKVTYVEESVDGTRATVRTKIVTKQGREIPIDYRLALQGDRWLIHDVVIENVSLVSNYRGQFNEIIRASSYKGLLEKIKKKLKT